MAFSRPNLSSKFARYLPPPPALNEEINDEMPVLIDMFSRVWRFVTRQSEEDNDQDAARRKLQERLGGRSMSPTTRVNNWRMDTSDDVSTPAKNQNNKRALSPQPLPTPDSSEFRNRKKPKFTLFGENLDSDASESEAEETDSENGASMSSSGSGASSSSVAGFDNMDMGDIVFRSSDDEEEIYDDDEEEYDNDNDSDDDDVGEEKEEEEQEALEREDVNVEQVDEEDSDKGVEIKEEDADVEDNVEEDAEAEEAVKEENSDETNLDEDTEMLDVTDEIVVTAAYTPPSASKIQAIRRQRIADADERAAQGWPEDDVYLYERLHLRGYEPLLSMNWEYDFRALPLDLFTRDKKAVVINSLNRGPRPIGDFYGQRSLDRLLSAGPRICERVGTDLPAEAISKKYINEYIQWSLKDAAFWKKKSYIPVVVIVAGSRTMPANVLFGKTVRSLERLRSKWEAVIHNNNNSMDTDSPTTITTTTKIPSLYAITLSHTAMFFFSHIPGVTSAKPQDSLRTVAAFNWNEPGKAVWTAFAVAILVVHCRDVLVDAMEGNGLDDGVMVEEEEDPDL